MFSEAEEAFLFKAAAAGIQGAEHALAGMVRHICNQPACLAERRDAGTRADGSPPDANGFRVASVNSGSRAEMSIGEKMAEEFLIELAPGTWRFVPSLVQCASYIVGVRPESTARVVREYIAQLIDKAIADERKACVDAVGGMALVHSPSTQETEFHNAAVTCAIQAIRARR